MCTHSAWEVILFLPCVTQLCRKVYAGEERWVDILAYSVRMSYVRGVGGGVMGLALEWSIGSGYEARLGCLASGGSGRISPWRMLSKMDVEGCVVKKRPPAPRLASRPRRCQRSPRAPRRYPLSLVISGFQGSHSESPPGGGAILPSIFLVQC